VYKPFGGITVGEFWKVVVSQCGYYPNLLGGGWKLLFRTQVRDFDKFSELLQDIIWDEKEVFNSNVQALLEEDEGGAVLWLDGEFL
jgi:hypothetical protein